MNAVLGRAASAAARPQVPGSVPSTLEACTSIKWCVGELGEPAPQSWRVRHLRKPEWGIGEVLREFDGKLEIAFEHGGTKVLKADLPFLQSVG